MSDIGLEALRQNADSISSHRFGVVIEAVDNIDLTMSNSGYDSITPLTPQRRLSSVPGTFIENPTEANAVPQAQLRDLSPVNDKPTPTEDVSSLSERAAELATPTEGTDYVQKIA